MDSNNINNGDEQGTQIQEIANQQDIAQQIITDFTDGVADDPQPSENSYNPQPNSASVYATQPPTNSTNLAVEQEGNEHLDNVPSEPYYHIEEDPLKVTPTEEDSGMNEGQVAIGVEQQYVEATEGILTEEYVQREDENFESQYETENNKENTVAVEEYDIKVEGNSETMNDTQDEIVVETVSLETSEVQVVDPLEECVIINDESVEFQVVKNETQEVTVEAEVQMQVAEQLCQSESEVAMEITELQPVVQSEEAVTGLKSERSIEVVGSEPMEVNSEEIEEQVIEEEQEPSDAAPSTKTSRRGRRPIHDVPMHLLGHDIAKPVDSVPNGRAMPKPRLGVKVPYRNLASQIISKEELEKEIIERSRAKEEAIGHVGDVKFARGLTQRLANKIAPALERGGKRAKKAPESTTVAQSTETPTKTEQKEQLQAIEHHELAVISDETPTPEVEKPVNDDEIIQNDDDLLAILEGEGEEEMPVLPKEVVPAESEDNGNLKMLEREIALQQLQELPHLEPKPRIFKSRQAKVSIVKMPLPSPRNRVEKTTLSTPKPPSVSETPAAAPRPSMTASKTTPTATKVVESTSKPAPQKINASPKQAPKALKTETESIDMPPVQRKPFEVAPQVKVNMVLKTYSRKRKPSVGGGEFETAYPKRMSVEESELIFEKSDPLALPTDVYVTKSSRVIKKKVIWDPDDETPSRKVSTTTAAAATRVVKVVGEKGSANGGEKVPMGGVEKRVTPKRVVVGKVGGQQKVGSPPKTAKTPNKSKRGLSEVDRLLMDEGAVKMLYELNNAEETTSPAAKRKKDYISIEKAEKDLIKKANQLKNDLVHNTSGDSASKSLRKKEGAAAMSPTSRSGFPAERKMSKDSTMSSIHTPPRSPTSFPGSMLVRRRSSSSTSSGCGDADDAPKRRGGRRSRRGDFSREASPEAEEAPPTEKVSRPGQYKSFTVKRSGKHVTIDVHYIDERCFLDTKVLDELISVLKKYGKDKECAVVSIVSSSTAFCLGLDYATLVSDDDVTKTCKATDLATKVRDFLLCLLNFPKVLVAGIQGECVGLGVTMLPLFDMIIASDTATFSAPYASLGCQGEAAFLLNHPNFTNNGLTAELLYAGTTLTADEAVRRGLISKLCWPEKYRDTLKSILFSISQGSNQSLEATKRQLRGSSLREVEASIKAETNVLIEQWLSPECQESFSKL